MRIDRSTTIRRARAEDIPAIVAVVNSAYRVEEFFKTGARTSEADIVRLMGRGETTFLVIDSDRSEGGNASLAGSVYVRVRSERGYFGLLAVDPAHHGRGLGRRLVEGAEAHCRVAGCTYVDIDVVNLREELPGFYAKFGYQPIGTAPFPERELLTREACLVLMTKELSVDSADGGPP